MKIDFKKDTCEECFSDGCIRAHWNEDRYYITVGDKKITLCKTHFYELAKKIAEVSE